VKADGNASGSLLGDVSVKPADKPAGTSTSSQPSRFTSPIDASANANGNADADASVSTRRE
jgi:hypothetical protein